MMMINPSQDVLMKIDFKNDLIVFSLDSYHSPQLRTTLVVKDLVTKKRIYFIESPVHEVSSHPTYFIQKMSDGVNVVKPYLPANISVFDQKAMLEGILHELMEDESIHHYSIWTDTPRSMPFIRNLNPELLVYDCLVDHSQTHPSLERELFKHAHVVITSGLSSDNRTPTHHGFINVAKTSSTELIHR
jgi:UDP-galactopyranose mutase